MKYQGLVIERYHKCAFKLVHMMASLVNEYPAVVQGTSVPPRGDLGNYIAEKVPPDIVVTIPNQRPCEPRALVEIKDEAFSEGRRAKIEEIVDRSLWDGYIRSDKVQDDDLKTEALTTLAHWGDDIDEDVVVKGLLVMFATTKPNSVVDTGFTERDYFNLPDNDNSSGYVYVDTGFGVDMGTKREMKTAAVVDVVSSLEVRAYRPVPKLEVLKKNKKVRQILCEPYAIYLDSVRFFSSLVTGREVLGWGDCTGFSRQDMNKVFFSMYLDHKWRNGGNFEDFIEYLDGQGVEESDIKNFEGTIGFDSGLAFVLWLMAQVKSVRKDDEERLCRVLAHYLCPPIHFKEQDCYMARGRVGSGSYLTLFGNNFRHLFGNRLVGSIYASNNNYCGIQGRGSIDDGVKMCGGGVLGDDRYREKVIGGTADVDKILRTTSISEEKSLFGDEAGEFLRVSPVRYPRGLTFRRNPERVFGKLYHGLAIGKEYEEFEEAVHAACLELGDSGYVGRLRNAFGNHLPNREEVVAYQHLRLQDLLLEVSRLWSDLI